MVKCTNHTLMTLKRGLSLGLLKTCQDFFITASDGGVYTRTAENEENASVVVYVIWRVISTKIRLLVCFYYRVNFRNEIHP